MADASHTRTAYTDKDTECGFTTKSARSPEISAFNFDPSDEDAAVLETTQRALTNAEYDARLSPCFQILEKVTFMSDENTKYLVHECTGLLGGLLHHALSQVEECHDVASATTRTRPVSDDNGKSDEESTADAEYERHRKLTGVCLRVLVNLTNEQPAGCRLVINWLGQPLGYNSHHQPGRGTAKGERTATGGATVLAIAYRMSEFGWNDNLVVALALLINLVEQGPTECTDDLLCSQLEICNAASRQGLHAQRRPMDFLVELFESKSQAESFDLIQPGPQGQLEDDCGEDEIVAEERLVAGYAAVLLGLMALRQPGAHVALNEQLGCGVKDCHPENTGEERMRHLVRSIRRFAVVHAQAGVLEKGQAQTFDKILALLGGEDQRTAEIDVNQPSDKVSS